MSESRSELKYIIYKEEGKPSIETYKNVSDEKMKKEILDRSEWWKPLSKSKNLEYKIFRQCDSQKKYLGNIRIIRENKTNEPDVFLYTKNVNGCK